MLEWAGLGLLNLEISQPHSSPQIASRSLLPLNRAGISLTTTTVMMMTTAFVAAAAEKVANRDRAIYAMQG